VAASPRPAPALTVVTVVNALSTFANGTLSALYLDVVKDTLYADARDSARRRAVVTVLEHVLTTMTHVLAPVLPHLAEEIHWTRQGARAPRGDGPSFFAQRWTPLVRAATATQRRIC
jgi:isoleucyl-tRNA synthetase